MRYLKLFRFPLVFTAMADSAAGYLVGLIRFREVIDPIVLILLAVASGGLYCFGMACNDIADRDRDKTIHPDRVIPSGRISVPQAYGASTLVLLLSAGAVLCLAITAPDSRFPVVGIFRLATWAGIAVLILLYNFWAKEGALLGAILMGLIRGGNFMLGLVYAPTTKFLDRGLFLYAGVLFAYVLCLTIVSTLEDTAPRRALFKLAGGGMIVAPIAVGAVGWFVVWTFYAPAVAAIVLFVLWIGARVFAVIREWSRARIVKLVRDGVMAIILLDASIVLWSGRAIEGAAVGGLLLPAIGCVWWFRRV